MYIDREMGRKNGDALVSYMKEPSVELAIKILDGAPFRPGGTPLMTVSPAKFEQKDMGDIVCKGNECPKAEVKVGVEFDKVKLEIAAKRKVLLNQKD